MEKSAILYILTPTILLFIVYMLIVTVSWPVVRTRSFVPLYLLVLLIIFPPAFFVFVFWFYLIHFGLLTSTYYAYQMDQTLPVSSIPPSNIPKALSQRERTNRR